IVLASDLQLLESEMAAQVHDQVHDLGQDHGVDDVALQDEVRRSTAHLRETTSWRTWSRRFVAAAVGSSAYITDRVAVMRHDAGSPFQAAVTVCWRSPRCAPMPGNRNGSLGNAALIRATSSGAVAPA